MDSIYHGGTKAPPYEESHRFVGSSLKSQNFIAPVGAFFERPRAHKVRPYEQKTKWHRGAD